jgi:hypothetical protein
MECRRHYARSGRLVWSNGVRAVLFTFLGLLALQAVHQRWEAMNRADA